MDFPVKYIRIPAVGDIILWIVIELRECVGGAYRMDALCNDIYNDLVNEFQRESGFGMRHSFRVQVMVLLERLNFGCTQCRTNINFDKQVA